MHPQVLGGRGVGCILYIYISFLFSFFYADVTAPVYNISSPAGISVSHLNLNIISILEISCLIIKCYTGMRPGPK